MPFRKIFYLGFVFIISLGLVTGCGKKESGTSGEKQKTEVKKDAEISDKTPVHIKYDLQGDEKGSLDMYFQGKSAKLDIKGTEDGKEVSSNIYIKDGTMFMVMDMMGKKVGMKMDVSKDEEFNKSFGQLYDVKDKLKEFTKGETEEILGYKCTVYTKDKEKVWIYKDAVALKFTDGKTTMVASAFEPDVKLTPEFFDPPKDVDFQSMDDLKNLGK